MARIPALTLSGGTLKKSDKVKEYRVWVHPMEGDDGYYVDKTLKESMMRTRALRKSGKFYKVENPLAVIWDKKHRKYREVVIPKKILDTGIKKLRKVI